MTIRIDLEDAWCHASDDFSPAELFSRAEDACNQLRSGSGRGCEWLGWRRLAARPDLEERAAVLELAEEIREQADVFIVCGIGGSYLGSRALVEAITGPFRTRKPEVIFAGFHMGATWINRLIRYLEEPLPDGRQKRVWINVISKSGSTLETALTFRVLREWLERTSPEHASERIIATTAPSGGVLNQLAAIKGYRKLTIPEDVGGRFSVLSSAGLLPIAVAGVDIVQLQEGAMECYRQLEHSAEDLFKLAALRYHFHEKGKALDVIGSFEPELQAFTGWVQQLQGESVGKEGKGLFPVPATWSADLHSIGQMVQQGRRNLIETLIIVGETDSTLAVQADSLNLDGLNDLDGYTFHEINRQALNGTVEAHREGGVPVIKISIERLDERNLGGLIYFYELFIAVYGYMLEINPFDQPGVEAYKRAMYRNLGR